MSLAGCSMQVNGQPEPHHASSASVEAGRSYYAVLDGAAAEAGFGARVQLTVHRTARAAWER